MLLAKALISSAVPGSCFPNWLQGKARTSKPLLLNLLCSSTSSRYWGVKPHCVGSRDYIRLIQDMLSEIRAISHLQAAGRRTAANPPREHSPSRP